MHKINFYFNYCNYLKINFLPAYIFMPFHTTIVATPECKAGLWHIQENISELLEQLPYAETLPQRLPQKQQQSLSAKVLACQLAQALGFRHVQISKNHYDAPFWVGVPQGHLSLSHTQHWAAAIVHKQQRVGIDIELLNPKIFKIKERVFHPTELEWLGNDLQKLTLAWCAKEALYKYNGERGVDFKNDLGIHTENGLWIGNIRQRHLPLHTYIFEDLALVYC